MATRAQKSKVGLFLLICLGILVGTVITIIGTRGTKTVTYYMKFDDAVTGLDVGANVEFKGVKIGTVKEIKVTEDSMIEVAIEINPEIAQLRKGVVAKLNSNMLSGISFVQITGGTSNAQVLEEGAYIDTKKGLFDTLQETLGKTVDKVNIILDSADSLISVLKTGDNDYALGRAVSNIEVLMVNLNETIMAIKDGDTSVEIGNTIIEFRKLLGQARAMIPSAKRGALGMQRQVQLTLKELRDTLVTIKRLTEMLEQDPSSLLHGKNAKR